MTPDPDPEPDPNPASPLAFPLLVERFYASLIRQALSAEAGLGGRLLYVGELGENGRPLMVAANIAGAASLAATADAAIQKQSIRDGVADFLVTTLDEALRILKNEIRKHEAVAVCVGASPASIEQEMVERGVAPDLVHRPGVEGAQNLALSFVGRSRTVAPLDRAKDESLLAWSVEDAPAQWLPRLDAIAMERLGSDESPSAQIARRWLRFAPRYLGRLARNVRVLRCSRPATEAIAERMRAAVQAGEIPVPVRIEFI
jgi:urocanate hydratase